MIFYVSGCMCAYLNIHMYMFVINAIKLLINVFQKKYHQISRLSLIHTGGFHKVFRGGIHTFFRFEQSVDSAAENSGKSALADKALGSNNNNILTICDIFTEDYYFCSSIV